MRLFIKYKYFSLAVVVLACVAMLVNACKKDNSDNVSYFLTLGAWQLASVQRSTFVGDTLKRIDTLNTSCNSTQKFTFTSSNACTYTNYHCLTQTSTGTWQISSDNLTLSTTMMATDTVAGGKGATANGTAFASAQIVNLGQYSLVLQTGYTSSFYTSKTKRIIYRYGFVHSLN